MKWILFFSSEKKIKNEDSNAGSDAVGEEVEPVACAGFYDVFLNQLGQAAVSYANDDGEDDGFFLVGGPIGDELPAIAPKACEGKTCIHQNMSHLVESYNGLDAGE